MSYLLDTDWLIDFLDNRQPAVSFVRSLLDNELYVSVVTCAEVYEGIYFGRNPEAAEHDFENFLEAVVVLDLDIGIAQEWAKTQGSLRQTRNQIHGVDLFIAATALAYDLTLVSRNRRHFDRVPGLKLISHPSELTDDL